MKYRQRLRSITEISLGAVLITLCAWATVPTAVPFTLQTFGVFAVCGILGGFRGSMAVLLYILLGTLGLPVFSSFSGGVGVLIGATGGFIIGFFLSALLYWLITRFFGNKSTVSLIAMLSGMLVYSLSGTLWYAFFYLKDTGAAAFASAFNACVLPFVIPDILKIILAVTVSERVRKYIRT